MQKVLYLCAHRKINSKEYDANNCNKGKPRTFTLTVPKADVSFFKTTAKKKAVSTSFLGRTIERKRTAKPRLYDPETGDNLNDATMKVIENARNGKDVIELGSMDDYLKLISNL